MKKDPNMRQLTKQEALDFTKTEAYKKMSKKDIAAFQLQQRLLCVEFDKFHECLEAALNRPVFTHELINPASLLKEMYGEKEPPTFEDILTMIPKEKRVVVMVHDSDMEG